MKSRLRSSSISSTGKREALFYRYLKPGALAQIRNSKITSKSKATLDFQIQIVLQQITASAAAAVQSTPAIQTLRDGFPCFSFRTTNPRCLHRKKMVAVTPIFCETQI